MTPEARKTEAIGDRLLMRRIGDRLLDAGLDDPQRHRFFGDQLAALEQIGAHRVHAVRNVGRQAQARLEQVGADEAHAARIAVVKPAALLQPPKASRNSPRLLASPTKADRRQRNVIDADPDGR
jgi:hypothetical protein